MRCSVFTYFVLGRPPSGRYIRRDKTRKEKRYESNCNCQADPTDRTLSHRPPKESHSSLARECGSRWSVAVECRGALRSATGSAESLSLRLSVGVPAQPHCSAKKEAVCHDSQYSAHSGLGVHWPRFLKWAMSSLASETGSYL